MFFKTTIDSGIQTEEMIRINWMKVCCLYLLFAENLLLFSRFVQVLLLIKDLHVIFWGLHGRKRSNLIDFIFKDCLSRHRLFIAIILFNISLAIWFFQLLN